LKIIADTNLLIRVTTLDNPLQAKVAEGVLANAELVAIPLQAVCELVWVLSRAYKIQSVEIAKVIRGLIVSTNVVINQRAVEAGLAMMDEGADFADGVIAFEGGQLGGETFVSFDRRAVKSLKAQGIAARLLA
jgi:predicted nucleic-acid-binding protein